MNIIRKSLRKIKTIILKPKYQPNIQKTANETFELCSYKGTSIESIRNICTIDHPETRIGSLSFGKHISIRQTVLLDLVGDITIGDYTIFADHVVIMTHDHNIKTKSIILEQDEINGVKYSNIDIGKDVFFGYRSVVVQSVTSIPDGVIIGANSVLTKNPGPYEIWAGTPAKKIGIRE
jgi:acetyltransferase-like isoleucine patch superfamily enzyme